jgi:hypothetical protein
VSKTHTELEQPAKVYQLEALDAKLETIGTQLKTIVNQTAGLATVTQLQKLEQDDKARLAEAVKDIHAEYRPTLKRNKALWGLVGAIAVLVVGQAILISVLRS